MSVLSIMQPFEDEPRRRPKQAAGNDDEAAAPGVFTAIGLQARVSQDETPDAQRGRVHEGYREMAQALEELGVPRSAMVRDQAWFEMPVPGGSLDYDKLWQLGQQHKLKLPVASQGEYERWLVSRRDERSTDQRALEKAGGASGFAAKLAGGAVSDMADSDLGPLQYMVGAGGKSLAAAAVREGALNVLLEAVKLPERVQGREKLGEPMSTAEQAQDVMMAGVGAMALTALGRGLGTALDRAGRPVRGAAAETIDRIAPGWRASREVAGMDLPPVTDREVLAAFDAAFPQHTRTPTEQAAFNVALREAEIDAASPFVLSHAADGMHRARLDSAVGGLLEPEVRPLARGAAAVEGFMRKVRGAESAGNDAARNPRSSAAGRYQFTNSTWLATYKRRFGAGESDKAILARKGDGALQDTLMRDLTAENASALREAGVPLTEGNLYLAHFAGPQGARKLHAADPEARVEDVLGAKVVEANPFLRGKTAREVIEWAHAKMGETPGLARAIAPDAAPEAAPARFEDIDLPELRRDLFDSEDAWRAAQREIDAEALGIEPLRVDEAPPEAGMVRLYRGEAAADDPMSPPLAVEGSEPGLWFATNPRTAEGYAGEVAPRLYYVDVPRAELDAASTRFRAHDNGDTYELTPEWAARKQPVETTPQASAPTPPARPPADLAAVSRPYGEGSGFHMFEGPQGRFTWHPQDGIANGAFPKRTGVTAEDVRAHLGMSGEPTLRDAPAARFDDPAGTEAAAQANFLDHDLRLLAEGGELDGLTFAALEDAAGVRAADLLARFDDEAAAIEALRGCL